MKKHEMVNHSRRTALFGALGGATLATVWQKPVINAVMLPAHAQTSPETIVFFVLQDNTNSVTQSPNRFSPLDMFIEPAQAGQNGEFFNLNVDAKAVSMGDGQWQVDVRNNQGSLNRTGLLQEGVEGTLTPNAGVGGSFQGCPPFSEVDSFGAIISSVNELEMIIDLDTGEGPAVLTIPLGDGELPPLVDPCANQNANPG